MGARIIAVVNHENEAERVTAASQLGKKLVEAGRRVLLVDGNPRCGLTRQFLPDNLFDHYYADERTAKENIMDGVKPAFKGRASQMRVVDCIEQRGQVAQKSPENLLLLPGHPNLDAYEPDMDQAMNNYSPYSMMDDVPGSFYELIRRCCEANKIDYAVLDTGPGMGVLNQMFFSICTGFIIPSIADTFSHDNLKAMKKTLPRWKKRARLYRQMFMDSYCPFPKPRMKCLGIVVRQADSGADGRWYRETVQYAGEKMRTRFREENMMPKCGKVYSVAGQKQTEEAYEEIARVIIERYEG